MESLKEMFKCLFEQSPYKAMRVVINSKMKNGSSIHKHVLRMINHFNEAEINGANIDEKTLV